MRAGMAVSAATTTMVTGTTASSCQSGGLAASSPVGGGGEERRGRRRCRATAPASAGSTSAAESAVPTCCGVAPRARASAEECLAVERCRPGDEDRVDGRQDDQHDHDHQQHLVVADGLGIGPTDELGVLGERCVGRQHGDDPADRDDDARRAEHDTARPTGGQPQSEEQRDGQARRDGDEPRRAPGWPGRVGQRVDRAACGRPGWRERGSRRRDRQRHGRDLRRPSDMVSDGAPAPPSRPAPGSASRGAASHPTASPAAAATRARTTYSASSTTATRRGVPPTALSSPTRRVWSAIRPPTSTATLAAASRSEQPAADPRGPLLVLAPKLVVLIADVQRRLQDQCARVVDGSGRRRTPARRPGPPASGSRHRTGVPLPGRAADVRLGEPDQAGLDRLVHEGHDRRLLGGGPSVAARPPWLGDPAGRTGAKHTPG